MFAKCLATQLSRNNSIESAQQIISSMIGIKTSICTGVHGRTVHAEHQSGLTTMDYSLSGKFMSIALTRSPSKRLRVLTRNPALAARYISRARIPSPTIG